MKVYTLERRQVLPADTGKVFSFFQNPENLGRMTPRWLGFQFLTPVPLDAKEGEVIDLRFTSLVCQCDGRL